MSTQTPKTLAELAAQSPAVDLEALEMWKALLEIGTPLIRPPSSLLERSAIVSVIPPRRFEPLFQPIPIPLGLDVKRGAAGLRRVRDRLLGSVVVIIDDPVQPELSEEARQRVARRLEEVCRGHPAPTTIRNDGLRLGSRMPCPESDGEPDDG